MYGFLIKLKMKGKNQASIGHGVTNYVIQGGTDYQVSMMAILTAK